MQPSRVNFWGAVVTGSGVILAVAGGFLAVFWPDIFAAIVNKEMQISPESKVYNDWIEPSIPLYFDIYFFNWTNAENFTTKDSKPKLVELGPYRFRERKVKTNVVFHPENDTVSYDTVHYWDFEEELSSGSLNDELTTLNVIAASAVYRAKDWNPVRQSSVSMGFKMFNQDIAVTKSVRELLFVGYQDPLLDFSFNLPDFITGGAPKVERFGWFYGRNGSSSVDGHMNVATGADGSISNEIRKWNYLDNIPDHKGECGKLKGSTGEFYPRKMKPSDELFLFSSDLCRSIPLRYEANEDYFGVDVMKFIAGEKAVDNGTKYSENECFCDEECQPSGVMNLSSCRFGSPTFVSFPHFLLADPYFADAVQGMEPDKDKHSFFISVEPTFGVPLEVAARFQINILVQPSSEITLYNDVPHIYMPIMWFEQHVKMPQDLAAQLGGASKISAIGSILAICVAITGVAIAAIAPITSYNRNKRKLNEDKDFTEEASVPLKGKVGRI